MQAFLQFLVLGLGVGSAYVLAGQGLVLVYKGSGVLNFSQGGMAVIGGFTCYELHAAGVPVWIAGAIGVLTAAACGALLYALIIRRLASASNIAKLVATLGFLTAVEGLGGIIYSGYSRPAPNLLPVGSLSLGGGIAVGQNRVWLIGIAVAFTALLSLVYRRTRFGMATRASAENELALSALAWSPERVAATNWAIGSALAAVAGILLAPITGLSVETLGFLLYPALAAALVGRFESFWLTLAGGAAMGVLQSEATNYINSPGWAQAVPFIALILFIAVRSEGFPGRAQLSTTLPRVGTARTSWPVILIALAIAVYAVFALGPSWTTVLTATFCSALILLSLVVVTGIGGQLSLAQYAFAGMGGYVAARLSASFGLPFLAVLVIAALVAVPIGVIVGLPAVRVRGSNLAIVTLVVSLAISSALLENPSYTGGNFGIEVRSPTIFGISVNPLLYGDRYALVCLVVLVLAMFMVRSVRSGAAGRRMLAVRANERAASALGVNVMGTKLYAFSLSAAIAAVAGVLIVFQESFAIFGNFTADNSILAIVFLVLSGVGYLSSTYVGGAVLAGGILSYALAQWFGWSDYTLLLIAGVLLMVSTVRTPNGGIDEIVGLTRRLAPRWMRGGGTVQTTMTSVTADVPVVARQAALSVRDLSVTFGGVHALTGVSLDVQPGQVVGLIGPNGAGKTTLIDAISGFVPRYAGSVTLDGRKLDGLSAHRRSGAGVGRSFQSLELFEDMTVGENLQVAADPHGSRVLLSNLVWPGRSPLPAVAAVAADQFELAGDLDRLPSELSYGRRRTLSIARAIAGAPRCLLLDEPAAGLDQHERGELASLILRIAHRWGLAVLVIEHDVELVLSVSDRVIALDFGIKIAEGSPEQIRRDPAVIRSYLGVGQSDGQDAAAAAAAAAAGTDSNLGHIGSAS